MNKYKLAMIIYNALEKQVGIEAWPPADFNAKSVIYIKAGNERFRVEVRKD